MAKRRELSECQLKEIREARKSTKDKTIDARLRAIELHGEGLKHKDISEKTGFVPSYVGELVKKYLSKGITAVAGNNYQGNHRLLSIEEEAAILEKFMDKATAGQLIEVSEIQAEYEKAIGRELNSKGHIYTVLKRHNIRKVMPRSKHPNKASDEIIHTSKKLKQLARK